MVVEDIQRACCDQPRADYGRSDDSRNGPLSVLNAVDVQERGNQAHSRVCQYRSTQSVKWNGSGLDYSHDHVALDPDVVVTPPPPQPS